MSAIQNNLDAVRKQIGNVTLIAVSKTHDIKSIREALVAGQRVFGENRVQEAADKFSILRSEYPDIELHLIGALQTNKVTAAVMLFDVIQTLDRKSLAEVLAKTIKKLRRYPRIYIEVNIGGEPQKAGINVGELDEFFSYCRDTCGLAISGLMCIPPHDKDPSPFFTRLRLEANRLQLPHISMGMSADFEDAIKCGATEVRVGTAVFGAR